MNFQSKLVQIHDDELVQCHYCERKISQGEREFFLQLSAPGFCKPYCMWRYYMREKNVKALTHIIALDTFDFIPKVNKKN